MVVNGHGRRVEEIHHGGDTVHNFVREADI